MAAVNQLLRGDMHVAEVLKQLSLREAFRACRGGRRVALTQREPARATSANGFAMSGKGRTATLVFVALKYFGLLETKSGRAVLIGGGGLVVCLGS